MQTEVTRLHALLQKLTAADASVHKVLPAAPDTDGQILELILAWRHQRKAAVQAEIGRLEAQLAALQSEGADHAAATLTPEEALVEWMKENGGQVSYVSTLWWCT